MSGPFGTPDPLKYGLDLPVTARRALRTAYLTKDGYRIPQDLHSTLKAHSLVDCQLPFLSACGTRVLKAIEGAQEL